MISWWRRRKTRTPTAFIETLSPHKEHGLFKEARKQPVLATKKSKNRSVEIKYPFPEETMMIHTPPAPT